LDRLASCHTCQVDGRGVEGYDSLTALLMLAVLRNRINEMRNCAVLVWIVRNGIFRFGSEEIAAQPNAGWYRNPRFGRVYCEWATEDSNL
jgi:hypothetical protein